eukprot:g6790.t1
MNYSERLRFSPSKLQLLSVPFQSRFLRSISRQRTPHRIQFASRRPSDLLMNAQTKKEESSSNGRLDSVDRGEFQELKNQVKTLTELVFTQRQKLELQEHELEKLKANSYEEIVENRTTFSPLSNQGLGFGDRRYCGLYDARFHSLHNGATPRDCRVLPDRIILVRHAESEGNVNKHMYSVVPDRKLPLTDRGWTQAKAAGLQLRKELEKIGDPYKLVFYISPYRRSYQTYQGISETLPADSIVGVFEDVQLREQDFGNFQNPSDKRKEMAERLEFGRFFYRFPNGESGADVYDRITIFEDHLVRDINAGRFSQGNTNLVLVTHGLALRIILMRWFHWTVDQFLNVYNPENCKPVILEKIVEKSIGASSWIHTKMLYRVSPDSAQYLEGTTPEMLTPQVAQPWD